MDVTTTTTDVDADAAPVYSEATAVAGFGLFSSSHAAETVQAYSATTDADVTVTMTTDAVTIPGFGLLSFSSSVVAATTTVAANS